MDTPTGEGNLIPFVLKRHLSSAGGSSPVSKRRIDDSPSELPESDEGVEQRETIKHEYQPNRVDNESEESDEEEEIVPRCKIDKGKGKAKAVCVPELPDDVWKRVFEMYLDDCAEDWHDSNRYRGALKPLLLSKDLTSVALPILYSHPMVSFSTIPSFLRALAYSSAPYTALPKACYVRHLTIRPSPPAPSLEFSQQAYKDYQSRHAGSDPLTIHASLPLLFHHIPQLHTFTLKETLILHEDDARLLFGALSLTRPKKARLEFRMWDLHDSPIGDVLVAANRPSIHHPTTARIGGSRQPHQTPNQRRNNHPGGFVPILEAWRDALLQGDELDIPSEWLDLGQQNPHQPPHPPAQIHPPVIPLAQLFLTTVHNDLSNRARATSRHNTTATSIIPTANDINHSPAHAPLVTSDSITAHSAGTLPQLDLSEASHADADKPSTDEIGLPHFPAVNLIHRAPFGPQSHVSADEHQLINDGWGNLPPNRPWAPAPPRSSPQPDKFRSQWASAPLPSATSGDPSSLGDSTQRRLQSNTTSPSISHPYPLGSRATTTSDEAIVTHEAASAASSELSNASSTVTHAGMHQSGTDATTTLSSVDTTAAMSFHAEPLTAVRPLSLGTCSMDNGNPSDLVKNTDMPPSVTPSSSMDLLASETSPPAPSLASGWYIPPTITTASGNSASTISLDDQQRSATRDMDIRAPSPDFGDLSSLLTDMPAPSLAIPSQSTESEAEGVRSRAPRSGSVWAIHPYSDESTPPIDTHLSQPPIVFVSRNGRSNRQSSRRRAANDAAANHTAANDATPRREDPEIERQMTRMPGVTGHALARVIRALLRDLIERAWSPRVHGLSVVLLDPLASLIVRAPDLDLWTRLPVEHIRVHLPRGCNPLAVFKGVKECAKDRLRRQRLAGDGQPPNPRLPEIDDEQRRIVGGDGMGGGLLHPAIELFEIEVNTLAEMHDEVWIKNGDQLPPEVCRILVGEHDWRDLKIGPSVRSNYVEDQVIPRPNTVMTDDIGSPHFSFVSIDDDSTDDESLLADSDEEGETYNAQAAAEQRMRTKERVMM